MNRRAVYLAVAMVCAGAGFVLGPLLRPARQVAPRAAVAWGEGADYEGYRSAARVEGAWREKRGHAFSIKDREETVESGDPRWERILAGVPRLRPQPGGCLTCHAALAGWSGRERQSYYELRPAAGQPIGCADCHEPGSRRLRITRPAFDTAYRGERSQQQLRALVCAQCHTGYYWDGGAVAHPLSKGLAIEGIEAHYDALGYADWKHAETGAAVLKVRHPQFEMWSQGVHARSGATCTDCHMPALRRGAMRVTDHRVGSPLAMVGAACGSCHREPAQEMKARAAAIQERTDRMMSRAEDALAGLLDEVKAAMAQGAPHERLAAALALERRAQLRLDFVRADRSRGFHAPQEALRMLAEGIDYARQGQISAAGAWKGRGPSAAGDPRK